MTDFRFLCVRFILFILDSKILSVTERHRSYSIATVSHSSLVENIESARQDWIVLIQN